MLQSMAQGGGGITGGDANCDVEVQFGDIDSTNSFSKLEVKANALANSAVKVHARCRLDRQ